MLASMLPLVTLLLASKAPEPPPSIDDLRGRYAVVEEWKLAEGVTYRVQPPPSGPLPEAAFRRSELDPKLPVDFSPGSRGPGESAPIRSSSSPSTMVSPAGGCSLGAFQAV